MNIPKDVMLKLLITDPQLRPWVKASTAAALANAFGCEDTSGAIARNVDPTVEVIIALTDKAIIAAPLLDKAAVRQVHALRTAVNG